MERPSVKEEWDAIYRSGKQVNRYPFDSVVAFVFRYSPKDRERRDVKILEVGCGCGNNLWFAAREGFDVYGFDGSPTAIDLARQRFDGEGLRGAFAVAEFTRMPYKDGVFDMVIDRGALCCVSFDDCVKAINEIRRVLSPGGLFFFTPYSDRHTSSLGDNPSEEYFEPVRGTLVDNGKISFFSRSRVCSLMKNFKILSMLHTEEESVLDGGADRLAYWTVIGKKNE